MTWRCLGYGLPMLLLAAVVLGCEERSTGVPAVPAPPLSVASAPPLSVASVPPTAAAPTASAPRAKPGERSKPELAVEIRCSKAIASSSEDDATVVFITPDGPHDLAPGDWFICRGLSRDPSLPCTFVETVDSGMLHARCLKRTP